MELQRDDLALAGGQRRSASRTAVRAQRHLGAVVGPVDSAAILGVDDERRDALAPAQLVERRVARDPEQPRALLAAAAVEGPPAPVGPLERERGHVLGRGAVTQQRRNVREDVVTAGAVERLEPLPAGLLAPWSGVATVSCHTLTTTRQAVHHDHIDKSSSKPHGAAPGRPDARMWT